MNANTELFDKLQKVRALAENAQGEHEGMAALLLYQKLLKKHGISEAQVDLHGSQGDSQPNENIAFQAGRIESWLKLLAAMCAKHMRCVEVIVKYRSADARDTRIKFIGLGDDARTAGELFNAARTVAQRWCREHVAKRTFYTPQAREDLRQSYLNGFAHGLDASFRKQEESGELGLMIVTPQAVKDRLKGLRTVTIQQRGDDAQALSAGYKDGQEFGGGRNIVQNEAACLS